MDEDKALETITSARNSLHSKGYVAYQDGWSNYYGNLRFYDAAKALDQKGELNLNMGMAYEIESSTENLNKDLESAFATAKYTTTHVNPHYIKFFIDGTVETQTGYVYVPYLDKAKGNGIANWTPEDFSKITGEVNKNNVYHARTCHGRYGYPPCSGSICKIRQEGNAQHSGTCAQRTASGL